MLVKLSMKNFKSFVDKTEIDLNATGYEILSKENKTNDNILTKKSKSFNDGPPKRKNKNNKNENKNDKNVIIKNLKIIDNSSSLNIIKSNKKDVIPKINKKN